MSQKHYLKPEVICHTPIKFETTVSGATHGTFPGRGWGVGGTPPGQTGQFPGGGSTGGVFPGGGNQGGGRP